MSKRSGQLTSQELVAAFEQLFNELPPLETKEETQKFLEKAGYKPSEIAGRVQALTEYALLRTALPDSEDVDPALTLWFSDIESGTLLWEKFPFAMQVALAKHDKIVLSTIERHGGTVFGSGGDGFFASFRTPMAALAAALDGQHALASADWGEVGELRVRIALRTGFAHSIGEDFGSRGSRDVNRVTRVLNLGHGGQILVSRTAAALLQDNLPRGVALKLLGMVPLRGLSEEEEIYQVVAEGLPQVFPPLRVEDAPSPPSEPAPDVATPMPSTAAPPADTSTSDSTTATPTHIPDRHLTILRGLAFSSLLTVVTAAGLTLIGLAAGWSVGQWGIFVAASIFANTLLQSAIGLVEGSILRPTAGGGQAGTAPVRAVLARLLMTLTMSSAAAMAIAASVTFALPVTLLDGTVPPLCDFEVDPPSGSAPFAARVESTSQDLDGNIIVYRWHVGLESKDGPSAVFEFPEDGTYDISHEVQDNDGNWAACTKKVHVGEPREESH